MLVYFHGGISETLIDKKLSGLAESCQILNPTAAQQILSQCAESSSAKVTNLMLDSIDSISIASFPHTSMHTSASLHISKCQGIFDLLTAG